jgi:hypothetical protein
MRNCHCQPAEGKHVCAPFLCPATALSSPAFEGVEDAFAVYTSEARWKNPDTRQTRPVRVIAYNPAEPVLPMADILTHQEI